MSSHASVVVFCLGLTAVCARAPGTARPAEAHAASAITERQFTEVHMGMPVRLVLHADAARADRVARAAFARIARLDAAMSDYRPDSELRLLERHADRPATVSRDLLAVVARALAVARATGGAFDPTVGPLVALWRQARRDGRLPDAAAIAAARARVGWERIAIDTAHATVRVPAGMRLDLGGIAKGYILQEALRIVRAEGVPALIEAGGDLVVGDAPRGRPGWHVDVPGADEVFARLARQLTNAALATSGPSFQFVEIEGVRYSHVIDPRTGLGVTHPVVARVIASDAALADALATAFTILDSTDVVKIVGAFPGVVVSRSPDS